MNILRHIESLSPEVYACPDIMTCVGMPVGTRLFRCLAHKTEPQLVFRRGRVVNMGWGFGDCPRKQSKLLEKHELAELILIANAEDDGG